MRFERFDGQDAAWIEDELWQVLRKALAVPPSTVRSGCYLPTDETPAVAAGMRRLPGSRLLAQLRPGPGGRLFFAPCLSTSTSTSPCPAGTPPQHR